LSGPENSQAAGSVERLESLQVPKTLRQPQQAFNVAGLAHLTCPGALNRHSSFNLSSVAVMNLRSILTSALYPAMAKAGVPPSFQPLIAESKNPQFGDYQANGAMAAAKALKMPPRELAELIAAALDLTGPIARAEVAGPGFINLHINKHWLAEALSAPAAAEAPRQVETVVIDYSGPNLAKEMHVGHLRSTIIGDCVARVLAFLGHRVIRQNHVGDWGTQFGMLIAHLESRTTEGAPLALGDLEQFYQAAKLRFDAEPDFAERARDYVVRLQGGDEKMLALWAEFRRLSLAHSQAIYQKLAVSLTADDVRGESAYNAELAPLVKDLQDQGLAVTDAGAQVVFLTELANKKGEPSPVIVQKADGGYLYATTDLAALCYRAQVLKADRVLYFIDARQSLHMQQVFTLAKKAGWVKPALKLEHLAFGTMLGSDGKPFKTRTGGTVKLADLLDEAVERALATVRQKNPALSDAQLRQVAETVGIGAVKYADLCKTRTLDYLFSWESMLSFEGNTGPYLQYAYTRIQSVKRKAQSLGKTAGKLQLDDPHEMALALKVAQFHEVVQQVADDCLPHLLCTYLYDLASLFSRFYEACPILRDDTPLASCQSRLQLCERVSTTLASGLELLGIAVLEQM
jgi:arginyl-tRNA synthetase